MKKKIFKLFVSFIFGSLMFLCYSNIYASNAGDALNSRMDNIITDINTLKSQYNDVLLAYPDVVNSLSPANKNALLTLEDNLLADDIGTTINDIKTELSSSILPEATEVLNAINDMENDARDVVNDAQDIVQDMSRDYSSLSTAEINEIVGKAQNAVVSLGINTNVDGSYNEIMSILNDAHTRALSINNDIKYVLTNYLAAFKEGLTVNNLQSLLSQVKSKDITGSIDVLINIASSTSQSSTLVPKLQAIKADSISLKNKILEVNNIDSKDILLFSSTQKTNISDKILLIEQDYIAFAKLVINDHAESYMQVAVDLSYSLSINDMITNANDALDTINDYKSTINKLRNGDFTGVSVPDSAKKLGILVSLGYVDVTRYNKAYVDSNFGGEINSVINFVTADILDYIDHIDESMKDEIDLEVNSGKSKSIIQTNIINKNSERFTTIDRIKALKMRVENELISSRADLKTKLNTAMPRVYDIFNNHILDTIEKIMLIENELSTKRYYYNSLYNYILTDNFMIANTMNDYIGLPSSKTNLYKQTDLVDSKVKTSSTLTITLSENVYQTYTFAVLGDVYADGKIDSRDYMAIKNKILGKDPLTFITQVAANAYTKDSKINSQDYMVIKNHIMGKDEISL